MKIAERIVMVLLVLVLIGAGSWIYFAVQFEQQEVRDAVARGEFEVPLEDLPEPTIEEWQRVYPNTVPLQIGSATVKASVADSLPERIRGLSDTPFLPEDVVKLFVFNALGNHSIWMKDMNYSIDILWATKEGEIVHIEENISPETYPASFESPTPAWYVVEANAGFVKANGIVVGSTISLTN